ncbi:MAG: restriction endonuclease [Alphaproteobacteria bacterium]|nr:restriction endonuclease [Alphaproteobacteria bacterium]
MSSPLRDALEIRHAVAQLGCDIYEPLTEHPEAVYTPAELVALLSHELIGKVFDAPIRTRAKLAKQAVAKALGYPIPETLRKTKPRFPGQDLDVYVQQSNNLQVWNDEISPTRRYAVLGLDAANRVVAVRVVEGLELAAFDNTGTLTSKYQASRQPGRTGSTLVSADDTRPFVTELAPVDDLSSGALARMLPVSPPTSGQVLTVASLHARLMELVGGSLEYSPSERQRGEQLHRAACSALGLGSYADTGRFPDILCQALEVKLQLAGTIDLGLVSPDSEEPALTLSPRLRHCDVRYLIAYAVRTESGMQIEHIVTSTGADFFDEFQRFGGLVQNRKLQLRLPLDFFHPKEPSDGGI